MQPKITEAHIVTAVKDFLAADRWRALKMEPISRREYGKGTGEIGMPDYLFLRYLEPGDEKPQKRVWSEVLWVEFKAPGKRPSLKQIEWHAYEAMRGALVHVVDDVDKFIEWYYDSGLSRGMGRWSRVRSVRK